MTRKPWLLLVLAGLVAVGSASAENLYVDGLNGSSGAAGNDWGSALDTIGEALGRVQAGDTIHVAAATYPENIVLVAETSLLGGYPPGGGARDPDGNPTIIDGQAAGVCVRGASGALLDGFVIQNGRADSGAGVLHGLITMTVRDCVIRNCVAREGNPSGGGGMYFVNSTSLIQDCLFQGNRMDIDPESDSTEVAGGAVHMWTSAPVFERCIFLDNHVTDETESRVLLGGGAWAVVSGPTYRGCHFEGNSATYGGGLGWWHESMPRIEDCTFVGNEATEGGGGICAFYYNWDEQERYLKLSDCVFQDNQAQLGAGMLAARNIKLELANCLFAGNHARGDGGGVHLSSTGHLRLVGSTMSDNRASHGGDGSALYCSPDSEIQILDSILAFNGGGCGIFYEGSSPFQSIRVAGSNVYGHAGGDYHPEIVDRTGVEGNISADPLFVIQDGEEYFLSEPATGDPEQQDLGRSPSIDGGLLGIEGRDPSERTTRTDGVADTGAADQGYHPFRPGPYLAACRPDRGSVEVDPAEPVVLQVRDRGFSIDPASLELRVDGQPATFETAPAHLGLELRYQPPSPWPDCAQVELEVTAANLDDPPAVLAGALVRFVTWGCTPTPIPSPTPPPPAGPPVLTMTSSADEYYGGEVIRVWCEVANPHFASNLVDLHVALEVYGAFYFFPYWDEGLHPILTHLGPGETRRHDILHLALPPEVATAGPFTFYGVMTRPDTLELVGEPGSVSFIFVAG